MDYLIQTQFFWHLGLSFAGVIAVYFILGFVINELQHRLPFAAGILIVIGYVYEILQGKQYDTGTDLIADLIGVFTAVILIVLINRYNGTE